MENDFEREEKEKADKALREVRAERYMLQSVARKALKDNEAMQSCLRRVNGSKVGVWEHIETKKAFYDGLMVCGRVWNCPICAVKISERRRKELKRAFDQHKKNGGYISMLTLTFSHKRTDDIKEIVEKFKSATSRFTGGKSLNKVRKEMGLKGYVSALEVTWSQDNGFHPHQHMVLFHDNKIALKEMRKKFFHLWKLACTANGLKTTAEHGVDLQNGSAAENYLTKHGQGKWSLDQEMTKAHIKKGKQGSLTPFDFLRKYLETEDVWYLNLFRSYTEAFYRKQQLKWSNGLKAMFDIEEKEDEDLAKEKTEKADILGHLSLDDWKIIRKYNLQAKFLDKVELYDYEIAVEYIRSFQIHNNTEDEE